MRIKLGPKLVNKKVVDLNLIAVMRELKCTWKELREMPLDVFIGVLKSMQKEAEENKKAMRKANKKRMGK